MGTNSLRCLSHRLPQKHHCASMNRYLFKKILPLMNLMSKEDLQRIEMQKNELAKKVFEVSHLTGNFTLRSGQVSSEYFDKYQFESRPEILQEIAKQMVPLIPKDIDYLGALEMGGIPIATALALLTGIPVVFVRKQPKDYGTCKFAEGPSISHKKICLVEDVITTGGQVALSAHDLREDGAIVDQVICVIDRSEGRTQKMQEAKIKMLSLFSMAELKDSVRN